MDTLMLDFDRLIYADYTADARFYISKVKNLFEELELLMKSIHKEEAGLSNLELSLEKLLIKVETLEERLDQAIEFCNSSES